MKSLSSQKRTLLTITFAVLLFWGLQNHQSLFDFFLTVLGMLTPFIIGLCMAFVLNVPMKAIEKHLFLSRSWGKNSIVQKIHRPVSICLVLLFTFLLIGILLFQIFPQLDETVQLLHKKLPGFVIWLQNSTNQLMNWLPELEKYIEEINIDWQTLFDGAIDFLQSGATSIVQSTLGIATGVFSGVMNILLGLVFAIYALSQKELFADQSRHLLKAYLNDKHYQFVLKTSQLSNKILTNFITGQCSQAIILGLLFFILMSVLGFPFAMLIAIIVAITALIPMFGAYIGYAFCLFLILVAKPNSAFFFTIVFLGMQQINGTVIYPRVVGTSVGLPSIWVLVAVTLGGSLIGITGMLVSVPLVSIAYALIRNSIHERLAIKEKDAHCSPKSH